MLRESEIREEPGDHYGTSRSENHRSKHEVDVEGEEEIGQLEERIGILYV
jgi:hypothetical protein